MLWLFLLSSVLAVESMSLVNTVDTTCPHLPCPFTGFCKHTVHTYYYKNGTRCQGCDQCIMEQQDAPKLSIGHVIKMCPMTMCMNPGPCAGTQYTYQHFMFNGLNCTGCPTCLHVQPLGGQIAIKRELVLGNHNYQKRCPLSHKCIKSRRMPAPVELRVIQYNK